MKAEDVLGALFALTARRLPLRSGKDRLYVSVEAMPHIVLSLAPDMGLVTQVDARLRGLEMRLESR